MTVEKGLLSRADALAQRLSLSRAELISRGLLLQIKTYDNLSAGRMRKKGIRRKAG